MVVMMVLKEKKKKKNHSLLFIVSINSSGFRFSFPFLPSDGIEICIIGSANLYVCNGMYVWFSLAICVIKML